MDKKHRCKVHDYTLQIIPLIEILIPDGPKVIHQERDTVHAEPH